jgi:hypothetical protein
MDDKDTKDHTEMTKEEVFKDYGNVLRGVKNRSKIKTRRATKKLKQCYKCGRVGDETTKHSLTGEHKPPFIWLCRQPCHDEVHKFGIKMTKEQKASLKQQSPCSIQFPTDSNIVNPFTKLIEPDSLYGQKFKQSFKRINSENKETEYKTTEKQVCGIKKSAVDSA